MVNSSNDLSSIVVIMLTMNQKENTIRCLESFRSVKSPSFRIVLWDNGSSDGTFEFVEKNYPEVLAHHHPTNFGAYGGRNGAADLAMKKFDPSFLLFIDNDTTVTPDFLDSLVAPFKAGDKNLAQTSPKQKFLKDKKILLEAGGSKIEYWIAKTTPVGFKEIDRGQHDTRTQCIASTCCMLVRTDVFRVINGFDTKFDPYGGGDLEFSLRVRKAGYYGLYIPDSVIYHDPTQTFEGGKYTAKYVQQKAKNLILIIMRHAPFIEKIGFFTFGAPFLVLRALIREGRKGNFRAIKGVASGIVGNLKTLLKRK